MHDDDQEIEEGTLRMGRVGRYRLLRPLGEGAMARVYLAELDALGGFRRKVALKVVRPEYARDEKFVLLLAREAMIGSRLQHPNIVQTLEFNEHGGRHFLALQFVEGETLADLLKKAAEDGGGGLPRVLVLESMIQVLKGLAYAHDLKSEDGVTPLGIIHRDLKPGNIMLSRHGQVKVMDFGIAKAKVAAANITTVGQVRGTPIYMAPEQVTGQDLDGRTDQFAAATVMFELLTGEQVFVAPNLIMIMQQVARADVKEAPDRADAMVPGLGDVLRRMWSRSLDDRYPSCADAAEALEELLLSGAASSQSVRIPPEETTGRRKTRKKRKKAPEKSGVLDFVSGLLGRKPPPKKRRRKKKRVEPPPEVNPNMPADSEAPESSVAAPEPPNAPSPQSTDGPPAVDSPPDADQRPLVTGEVVFQDSTFSGSSSMGLEADPELLDDPDDASVRTPPPDDPEDDDGDGSDLGSVQESPRPEAKLVSLEDPPSAPALSVLQDEETEDLQAPTPAIRQRLTPRPELLSSSQGADAEASAVGSELPTTADLQPRSELLPPEPAKDENEVVRTPSKTLFDPPTSEHFSLSDEPLPEAPAEKKPFSDSESPSPAPEAETVGWSSAPAGPEDEDDDGEEGDMDDFFFGDFND